LFEGAELESIAVCDNIIGRKVSATFMTGSTSNCYLRCVANDVRRHSL